MLLVYQNDIYQIIKIKLPLITVLLSINSSITPIVAAKSVTHFVRIGDLLLVFQNHTKGKYII